ncbi:MAG: dephospho-CoA kinase [Deltaproteobacteria bacterium]|nr:dephospho-CoA kinase [Deltaproteobacteria bacterium]
MLWIGLTGGIASGKSTVAKYLAELGYCVISADQLAHQAMLPGSAGAAKILSRFGPSVFLPDGTVDRAKLGKIVFEDSTGRSKLDLEAILHPEVRLQAAKEKERCRQSGRQLAFYEIPLLFEKKLESQFDKIVCIAVDPQLQIQRLMSRSKLDRPSAAARIQSQYPQDVKVKGSDEVIWNNGSLEELKNLTSAVVKRLHQP